MQMPLLQAKDQSEDISEADRSKMSTRTYAFLGIVASALVPVVMSLGLIRQLQESISLEMLFSIGALVILIVLLFALSARQRYNERIYLRAWKARRDQQLALKHQRQMEALERGDRESRRRAQSDQTDLESEDEAAWSIEARFLRSLGLETPS